LPATAVSVPLGAQRLTKDYFDHSDAPSSEQVANLYKYIREVLEEYRGLFPAELPQNTVVTGTSKTFRSLARLAGAAPSTDGLFVPRKLRTKDLGISIRTMAVMSEAQSSQLPGVADMRARQVLVGGMVAQVAMEVFDIKKLKICPWALREGLILGRLDALRIQGRVVEASES